MPAGFEMELAQEACQRMKAECEFVAFKWDDLIPGLLDKKFDVIMSSMEVTSERRKRHGPVAPLLSLARRLHRRQGRAVRRAAVAAAQQAHRRAEGFDACRLGRQELPPLGPAQALRHRRRGAGGAGQRTRSTRCSATRCSSGCGARSPTASAARSIGQDIKDNQTLGLGVSAGLRKRRRQAARRLQQGVRRDDEPTGPTRRSTRSTSRSR